MVSEPGRAEEGPRAEVRLSAEVTLPRSPGLWLSLWASVPHLHPQGLVQVSEVGRAEGEPQVWEAGGVGGRPGSSGLGEAHPPPAPHPPSSCWSRLSPVVGASDPTLAGWSSINISVG